MARNWGPKALGGRVDISGTHLHSTIIVDDAIKSDEGIYTLEVQNELGSASVDIPIYVIEPPNPPTDLIITDIDKHAVTLTWEPPEYDGGSPVTGYVVERLDPSTGIWRYALNCPRPACTVNCLDEHQEHRFRVMAENMFAVSEPSKASMAATTKEPIPTINYEDFYDSGFLGTPVDVTRIQGDVLGKYIICEELGRGAFGVVHRAIERATTKNWAAKFVRCRPGDKDLVRREIDLMNSLHHPKLLQLHEAFDQPGEMVMILELLSGGELFDRLVAEDYDLKEADCIEYMRQVCQGVQHMHRNNIIHLDLKPENVMCVTKDSNDVKIIDFGLAQRLEEGKQIKVLFGTAEFCAPEIINFEPVSFCTDMWSLGVVSYVLLSGYSPFAGEEQHETFSLVNNADYDFDDDVWDNVSDEAKDFIKRLLIKDKKQRMTIDEALAHPWLNPVPAAPVHDVVDGWTEKKLTGQTLSNAHHKDYRLRTKHKEDAKDALPIGRLSRDSAVFRKEGDAGVLVRKLVMELPEHAPVVYEELTDVSGFEGSRVQLSCKIIGKPTPQIKWLKEGQEITQDARHHLAYKEGVATLQVLDLEPEDAGQYTCQAINSLGDTETTAELMVEEVRHRRKRKEEIDTVAAVKVPKQEAAVIEGGIQPEFTLPLVDQVRQVGEDVELSVTVTGYPEPEIRWYKGDRQISPSSHYVIEQDKNVCHLTIHKGTPEDAGEWRCLAVNPFGQAWSSCDLKILEAIPEGHRAPRFPHELEDMTVTRGSMVQLECEVIGFPQPAIEWYKDRKRIQSDKHYDIRTENNLCTLQINNVDYDDSGSYMCRAVNDAGSSSTEARIRVQSVHDTVKRPERAPELAQLEAAPTSRYKYQVAPDFTAKLKNKKVPEGLSVHLNCSVTGIPEPRIRWLKDGEEIFEGTEYSMRNNYGLLSLEVLTARAKHAGTYTCEASNEEGTVSCSAKLEIEAEEELEELELEHLRPRFLTHIQDVTVDEGDDVTFECKAVGKPMPKFKWHKDMLELYSSSRILITSDSSGNATMTIRKVKASDAGLYFVQAQSRSGRNKSSATLHVREKVRPPSPEAVTYRQPSFEPGYSSVQKMAVPGRPPSFSIMLPAQISVHEGEKLRLDCSVQGIPQPVVTWNKGHRGLMYGQRHRIMFVGSLHTLEIPSTMALDKGEYIVRAANAFGCVETSCMVTILPPRKKGDVELPEMMYLEPVSRAKTGEEIPRRGRAPFFIKHLPHTIEVQEGTSVRLDCILRGGVELVQWSDEDTERSKKL
ncbi:titin homolog isoform X1 [Pomacea canaliculata]|uniref:titin homolog isoform X1 n=1 Tax=Pomacea canaliculata TaxID=400727 RepID=UPI000D732648|nr:titin homolog isoform X1 [Pomacea canaliculata]